MVEACFPLSLLKYTDKRKHGNNLMAYILQSHTLLYAAVKEFNED